MPCNIRREGGESLVILEGRKKNPKLTCASGTRGRSPARWQAPEAWVSQRILRHRAHAQTNPSASAHGRFLRVSVPVLVLVLVLVLVPVLQVPVPVLVLRRLNQPVSNPRALPGTRVRAQRRHGQRHLRAKRKRRPPRRRSESLEASTRILG